MADAQSFRVRIRNNDFHTGFTLSAYARIIPGSIFAINNTNV
jgi:hypothetical protein